MISFRQSMRRAALASTGNLVCSVAILLIQIDEWIQDWKATKALTRRVPYAPVSESKTHNSFPSCSAKLALIKPIELLALCICKSSILPNLVAVTGLSDVDHLSSDLEFSKTTCGHPREWVPTE